MKTTRIQREVFSQETITPTKNFMFSPFSLKIALSTLLPGVEGKTREALLELLDLREEEVPAFLQQFVELQSDLPKEPERLVLSSANSIWQNPKIELKAPYLAEIGRLGVEHFPAPARKRRFEREVNTWVKEKTNRLIEKIPFHPSERFSTLILNALYFKAKWEVPFESGSKQTFFLGNGKRVYSSFLVKDYRYDLPKEKLQYFQAQFFQWLSIPYQNTDFVMDVLLPAPKVHPLSSWLEVQQLGLKSIYSESAQLDYSYVMIPKFEFELNFKMKYFLTNVLKSELFQGEISDFDRMLFPPPLPFKGYELTKVQQAFKIKVDELGTEAAATSFMNIDMAWGIPQPKEHIKFIANRPFFFFIRDQRRGEIYFQGFVANPLLG